MLNNYSKEVQTLFLEMMLSDPTSYSRVTNIYNPENFDRSLRPAATFLKEHCTKYNTVPTIAQINSTTESTFKLVPDVTDDYVSWFLDEFEAFTRKQELERAILKSADLLEKGDFGPVTKLITDAVQISLSRDLGTDYFASPKERIERIRKNNGEMSTGWKTLDDKLYGGWSRGTLNIVAGQSGAGKSLFLQNWAVNLSTAGKNGAYITLELSEELCALRIDAMMLGCSTKAVFKDIENTELRVKVIGKKSGELTIKELPAQCTVNDIRSFLKEWEISKGKKLDFICVDYLDLLLPAGVKVNPSDLFVKDKYVAEEVRNLAKEFNVVCLTASQLNRSSIDEIEFDHSHISGGISKINSADNVFAIFTSRAMKERGQYQLQLIKTRSSAGVGQKIDLSYNVESMRIEDLGEDAPKGGVSPTALVNQIKAKSKVTETIDPDTGEITTATVLASNVSGEVQSSKLKAMLAGLKTT